MKKIFIWIICIFIVGQSISQNNFNVYPTHWWVGMKNPKLQLMIHRDHVGMESVSMQAYPGVKLVKTIKAKNPNYIFMDLVIEKSAKPGTINFKIINQQSAVENVTYELKQRSKENGKTRIRGITSEDFIFLFNVKEKKNETAPEEKIAEIEIEGQRSI